MATAFDPAAGNTAAGKTALVTGANAGRGLFLLSPAQGAEAQVWLATAPTLEGKTGCSFHRKKETEPSLAARDDEAARRLFRLSAELVGVPA